MLTVEAIASWSVGYSREIEAQDYVPCMNQVVWFKLEYFKPNKVSVAS